jgi:hypothetical protein
MADNHTFLEPFQPSPGFATGRNPTWARASSAREAEEMGLTMWRRRMPQEGGWSNHTCRAVIIPDDAIIPDVIPRVRITVTVPDAQSQ